MIDLKDIMIVFDSTVLPLKPLQVIYYEVRDLVSLGVEQVDSYFKQTLGSIFPETEQRVIQTLWLVDNLPRQAPLVSPYKVAEDVIRHRDHLGHIDHLILQKFAAIGNGDNALVR